MDPTVACENVRAAISKNLKDLKKKSVQKLLDDRYGKYRKIGQWTEEKVIDAVADWERKKRAAKQPAAPAEAAAK